MSLETGPVLPRGVTGGTAERDVGGEGPFDVLDPRTSEQSEAVVSGRDDAGGKESNCPHTWDIMAWRTQKSTALWPDRINGAGAGQLLAGTDTGIRGLIADFGRDEPSRFP
ncbi:hypothetical protein [Streptomyces sp. NRRL S-1521]|uniref:hypothetical protein n=1 Tax=Streptomyces sp. NRRL S-1521 TaxID=1609100 RepID=UPI00131DB0BC|nr:hypothetical protein [Streptomyces sp. NRRL S-1521]